MESVNKYFYIFFLIASGALFISSCSVEKRHYREGYYIIERPDKNIQKKISCNNSAQLECPKLLEARALCMDSRDALELASLDNDISFLYLDKTRYSLSYSSECASVDTCSTIELMDGTTISAVVIEISSTQIKYQKCDRINSPMYIIESSKVYRITYPDGSEDIIQSEEDEPEQDKEQLIKNNRQTYNTPSSNSFSGNEPKKLNGGALAAMIIGAIASPAGLIIFLFFNWVAGIIVGAIGLIFLIAGAANLAKRKRTESRQQVLIRLKNGLTVRGYLMENKPGKYVRLQEESGLINIYSASDIESIDYNGL